MTNQLQKGSGIQYVNDIALISQLVTLKPRYTDESIKTDSLVFEARMGSQHKAGENMKLVEKGQEKKKTAA